MTADSVNTPFFNLDKLLRRLLPLVGLGVAGNLVFSYLATDRQSLTGAGSISWGWLFAALLLALLPWGWHGLRLKIWARFFDNDVSWKKLVHIAIATDVGSAATPTAVGGAPLKLLMLIKEGFRPGHAAMLTLLGNVEDVFFYVLFVPISLWMTQHWDHPLWQKTSPFLQEHRWKIAAFILVVFLIFVAVRRFFRKKREGSGWLEKQRRMLNEFREAWQLVRTRGRKPFMWSLLTLSAQWLTRFSVLVAVLKGLGVEADLLQIYLLQWMVFMAALLVPTPGAIGGVEAAFLLVFGDLLPLGSAPMVMACWRMFTYYLMLMIGAAVLVGRYGVQR